LAANKKSALADRLGCEDRRGNYRFNGADGQGEAEAFPFDRHHTPEGSAAESPQSKTKLGQGGCVGARLDRMVVRLLWAAGSILGGCRPRIWTYFWAFRS